MGKKQLRVLTILQIKQLLSDRKKGNGTLRFLTTAKSHAQDIRLHTEADVENVGKNPSYQRFLRRVDGYLVKDKFKVFKKYHRFPMSTTATCSDILSQLNKVFDGKNAIRSLAYSNERVETDFNQYLSDTNFHQNWRSRSLNALATGFNSILVADMPVDKPEPYYYFLSIEAVFDIDVADDGKINWVSFFSGENLLTIISQEGWQVVKMSQKAGGEPVSIVREAENKTGKEICWFWWLTNLNGSNNIIKKSPFSEWISKLDWLEVWSTWKRMLDAFGSNPVMWTIQEDCNYNDPKTGVFCDGGYLKNRSTGQFVRGESSAIDNGHSTCPKCSDKRFVGPGSVMEIPAPDKDSDMRAPFGVVPIDKSALDNAREEESRLRDEIVRGVTGGGSEPLNKEAINDQQVSALFEGWTGVLRQIKKSFEGSEEKLLEVMAALRYGGDVLDASINYGSEFYLMTEQEALTFYVESRKLGVPDYILDVLLNEYYKTKFRFDAKGFERVKILMAVEPFKHMTKADVIGLSNNSALPVNQDEVALKINFGSLVQRFETENGNVADFGVAMTPGKLGDTFSLRVKTIKDTLIGYIQEQKVVAQPPKPEPII
jgi:hypothetical protein